MIEKGRIPALSRMVEILDYISREGECSAFDIVQALEIPQSTTYLMLEELVKYRFLHKKHNGQYMLWLKLIDLSSKALQKLEIRQIAEPFLTDLMNKTGLVCHLGILDQENAYYILKVESPLTVKLHTYEGKAMSLVRSGIGKCLLAYQSEEKQAQLINAIDYVAKTKTSITSKADLIKALEVIRQQGWSYDEGEDVEGIRCYAAPIFNMSYQLVAAISVVGTVDQMTPGQDDNLIHLVKRYAGLISQQLMGKI